MRHSDGGGQKVGGCRKSEVSDDKQVVDEVGDDGSGAVQQRSVVIEYRVRAVRKSHVVVWRLRR